MLQIDSNSLVQRIPEKDFKNLKFIFEKIKSENGEVYLIGGSVRDLILNHSPKEYDLTTSLKPQDIQRIFKRVVETGIKHGTVTILIESSSYEITTYRKDIDYVDGRRPESVEFGTNLSEDLSRRDFTMNGIALDILNFKMVDEHFGIQDIEKKLIRTILDPIKRFSEDGLRPIRAIRFQSSLGFKIEEKTYSAIEKTKSIIEKISKERFHDELIKILESPSPRIGIEDLMNFNIFELFCKINYKKKFQLLENLNHLEKNPISLRLSYLIYEILGLNESEAEFFFKSIRFSTKNSKEAKFFYKILFPENNLLLEPRKLLFEYVKFLGNRKDFSLLKPILSIIKLKFPQNEHLVLEVELIEVLKQEKIALSLKDLKINGNTLVESFPQLDKTKYSLILNQLMDMVLENPESNEYEILLSEVKKIIEDN